jgi:bifunctional DNA-binding transcriptional regulator/antitoxin component of YhaV-PrlF toxin-antitoxin module
MAKMKLSVRLEHTGEKGTAAFVLAPFDPEREFGARRVPIRGTINGVAYRSTLCKLPHLQAAKATPRYGIAVCKELRDAAGIKPGDTVTWTVERDTSLREVQAPPALALELRKNKTAKANFDAMSFTHRKEIAKWITEAKHEETRLRRVAKAMDVLRSGKKWA